jgi:predicted NBD/HSP70 family sugar kinase
MPDIRELLSQPSGIKEENRLKVLKALMARPGNQADLARRAGLSQATISTVIKELTDDGTVEASRDNARRAVKLRPVTGVAVGIELGYRHIAAVGRQVHQPAETARIEVEPVGAAHGTDAWLQAATRMIHDVVGELGEHRDDIGILGLGVPRMVHPVDQSLTPPVLPPWKIGEAPAVMLAAKLRALAGARGAERLAELQVRLDNDASLGALAESVYQHPDAETLVYVKASTGVGAGIVIGGRVFRGARGVAGEIGHIMIQPRGRFCQCGGRGCLETLIGGDAMLSNAKAVLGAQHFDPPQSVDELVKKARDGDPVCARVLREAAIQLGHTIGNLCNALNPNIVVLGGALGRAADLVLGDCLAGIERSAIAASYRRDFALAGSSLKHATAHGALLLGIEGGGT